MLTTAIHVQQRITKRRRMEDEEEKATQAKGLVVVREYIYFSVSVSAIM